MDIEKEAILAIETLAMRNKYLSPFLDANDKTPVWDGFIYLYHDKNQNHPKDSLVGRVPVQVKGKKKESLFEEKIKYAVRIEDLRAFESEGGSIFIVVCITANYETEIYYKDLLPLDLARIIKKTTDKHQKSKTLEFEVIPKDEDKLANLFLNFIENRKKQSSTVDHDRLYFDDWGNELENVDKFVLTCSAINCEKANYFEILTSTSVYLYIKPKGYNVEIPIDRLTNGIVKFKNNRKIGAGNRIFYDDAETTWKTGIQHIAFGNIITISIKEDKTREKIIINFKFDLRGSLEERIYDGEFIKCLYEENELNINGIKLPFENLFDKDPLLKYLSTLRKIKMTIDELEVRKDLQLSLLKKEELWKLDLLENMNSYHLKSFDFDEAPIQWIIIANIKLIVWINRKNENAIIEDYFGNFHPVQTADLDKNNQRVSQFLILTAEELLADNLREVPIFEDIIKYNTWPGYAGRVNWFLLEVIKAYDINTGKSEELYQLAIKISLWLCGVSDDDVYRVNYYQIKIRREKLTDDDINECNNIVKNKESADLLKVCVHILLGNQQGARCILDHLSVDELAQFETFPICKLLQKNI